MRFATLFAFGLLSAALLPASAQAHEFFVVPRGDAAAAAPVIVEAQAAHVFLQSEEAEKAENVRVELMGSDGGKQLLTLTPGTASKALEGVVKGPVNGPAWLIGHRLPEIWSATTEGVLPGDRAALEAQGKTVRSVGRYEKFTKTALVPGGDAAFWRKPLGQTLEIVPQGSLDALKTGDTLTVQVLLDGKPLPQAELGLSHEGYSKEEDTYKQILRTDAQGKVSLSPDTPALWLARVAVTRPVKDAAGVDEENLRATLLFPVK